MPREMTKLETFQTSDWDKQRKLLKDPESAAAVKAWLGAPAFAELKKMCDGAHLSGAAET